MNSAEKFEDHEPSILNEVGLTGHQEEVILQYSCTLLQLLLCGIKVKVDIQMS